MVLECSLPLVSATVNVTVLSPKSEQLKLVLSKRKEATEQLSLDPLSNSSAVRVAAPFESKNIIMLSLENASGAIASRTVTVAILDTEFPPSKSVIVKVTVLSPKSLHVNVFISSETGKLLQSEFELLT